MDVPTSKSTKHSVQNWVCYPEFDWKGLKVLRCFGRTECDTHRMVILRRSRVGNGSRPQVWMHALCGYIKRVVLGFSRDLCWQNKILEDPGHGPENVQRGSQQWCVSTEGWRLEHLKQWIVENCCSIPCDNSCIMHWQRLQVTSSTMDFVRDHTS